MGRCQENNGFSIVPAMVKTLSFHQAQAGEWGPTIEQNFAAAMNELLGNPKVKAITGNCGFLANYQDYAEKYAIKYAQLLGTDVIPVKLSSMSLTRLITGGLVSTWDGKA